LLLVGLSYSMFGTLIVLDS